MSDLPSLPAWAKTLQRRIRQRGIDFFILHGPGVRDLHPLGTRRFGTIAGCLAQVILNDRSAIVTYDRRCGDRVLRSGRRERLQDGAQGVRQAGRDEPGPGAAAGSGPRAPADRDVLALPALRKPALLGRRYNRLWRDGGARGRAAGSDRRPTRGAAGGARQVRVTLSP